MTNIVISIYEDLKSNEKFSLFDNLKKLDLLEKIYFLLVLIDFLLMMAFLFMKKDVAAFYSVIAMFIITIIWIILFRISYRKKWSSNLDKYNQNLDLISKALKEAGITGKNQKKQLIRKLKEDILQLEKQEDKKKTNFEKFSTTYIIPIIAFCAGKYIKDFSANDVVSISIVVIACIFGIRMLGLAIGELRTCLIYGNELQKKQEFLVKLQDLVDRDFEIENEDLI